MIALTASGQPKLMIDDGPYISIIEKGYKVRWIKQNKLKTKKYKGDLPTEYHNLNFPLHIRDDIKKEEPSIYADVSKIAAISDIHGQYDVMIKLFSENGIINEDLEWSFGDGHLVITGDIFDRGDQVTEILWFVYALEAQALKAGGKLHFLLGNHELMVLDGDDRYIHKKYRYTMALMNQLYRELFDPHTVLGEWLRSKHISIKINDIVFVHGGFSNQVLKYGISLDSMNQVFREDLIDQSSDAISQDSVLADLYFERGPLWYRGYATETFSADDADAVLAALHCDHVVVGHTSMKSIVSIFDDKIIFIDSSIKFGKRGEVLFWEKGAFSRGDIFGNKQDLISSNGTK